MLVVVANAAIRMLLFGAAVWLVIRVVRLRNAHAEALVWRMVLLASLALPALLYWRVAPNFVTPVQLPVLSADGAVTPRHAALSDVLPIGVLVTIYLAGASLLLVRLAFGLVATWRISHAAEQLPARQAVRVSSRMRSPATFGSTVLLPADARAWPAERLDAVLAHERAHVRSCDAYWSWLAQIHVAIFWFSPLAWWLHRRLEWLAETTSDDAVVAARHDPVAYAELLLDFARSPNHRRVAMSVADSDVSKRINRLLARNPPARELPRAARWLAVALLVPAVVFAASTTRTAPDAPHRIVEGLGIAHPVAPDDYYPAVAKDEQVEGFAIVEVDLDVIGQLVDARVVDVQPADPRLGFADAALRVARESTYRNRAQQPGSLRFKVAFVLDDK